MALVDYSDSDSSEVEETSSNKPKPNSSKPAFQKLIDRSNPGKIKVNSLQSEVEKDTNGEQPPAKRAKTGPGGVGGFNSFLPAPKKAGVTQGSALGSGNTKGNGVGTGLRTGAAPAFSREQPEQDKYITSKSDQESSYRGNQSPKGLALPASGASTLDGDKAPEEVKVVGRPLMFKPLSVSRKPAKKKKIDDALSKTITNSSSITTKAPEPPRSKVSLFSVATVSDEREANRTQGAYQPLIYGIKEEPEEPEVDDNEDDFAPDDYNGGLEPVPQLSHTTAPQSLNDIASDLGLSAADRRLLFGRQKGTRTDNMPSASKVINFNTDEEYRHNEELRAKGEQVVHNPVRSIAPGKHSLKQLLNAAQSQKEALEESFAKGKNNRAEASSRYGW